MSRPFVDSSLRALAARLKDLEFDDPSGYWADCAKEVFESGLPRHVYHKRGLWCVAISYGARSYTIGVMEEKPNLIYARQATLRFADLATLFFWPYRQRGGVKPTTKDMNFTVVEAETELANNEPARALLEELEAHFVTNYEWRTRANRDAQYAADRPDGVERPERCRTQMILDALKELNLSAKQTNARLAEIERKVSSLPASIFVVPPKITAPSPSPTPIISPTPTTWPPIPSNPIITCQNETK